MIRLFTIDKIGEVTLDRDEIRLHPPLYKLFQRDKGSEGDSDGRKKLMTFKECAFIYFLADVEGDCAQQGYTGKEADERGIKFSRLPFDYKRDKVFNEAVDYYKEHQDENPENLILIELKSGLRNNYKIYHELNNTIEEKLELLKKIKKQQEEKTTKDNATLIDDMTATTAAIDTLLKYSKNIYEIISEAPKAFSEIEKIETKVKASRHVNRNSRGNKKIGNRADPK